MHKESIKHSMSVVISTFPKPWRVSQSNRLIRLPIVPELGLRAPFARPTHDDDIAAEISDTPAWSRPVNIYYLKADKTLLPLQPGQFIRCGGRLAESSHVVIAESYKSGLAIKALCSDKYMVVCTLTTENLNPVIEFFRPYKAVICAPDSDAEVLKGVPVWTPEKPWVELYSEEVLRCKAA